MIRPYGSGDAGAFRDLNVAWITKHFTLEDKDRELLDDPDGMVLGKGGRILVAELDGTVVGTVALMPQKPGRAELCKMAVSEAHRGHGIGKALMLAAEDTARSMGASSIWLETNTVLGPAIGLYTSCGYEEATGDDFLCSPYQRCNAQFVKAIA